MTIATVEDIEVALDDRPNHVLPGAAMQDHGDDPDSVTIENLNEVRPADAEWLLGTFDAWSVRDAGKAPGVTVVVRL